MPSTYTQNLGIELPATGEQANVWGLTVNRNMGTLDTATNGNIQLTIPGDGSVYALKIDNGQDSPRGANKLIIWTGSQTQQGTVQIDWQAHRQHLHIMKNQTSGGFPIAFAQGSGPQFVLQAGYDAILYADGQGATASVAAALANPQFNNVLLSGSLGVGHPSAVPDALTVNGMGTGGYAQLRLVYGAFGVIFRNDGGEFYLMVTAAGDPYGTWTPTSWPMSFDLGTHHVGIGGWGPDAAYTVNAPNIQTAGLHVVGTGNGILFPDGTLQTTAATGSTPPPPPATNTIHFLVNHTSMGSGPNLDIYSVGGGITLTSLTAGSYGIGYSSDARLKQHVQPLTGGLSVVERLHPVRAEWNGLASTTKGQRVISVLAQDLRMIEPDAVYPYLSKLRSEDEATTELLAFDPMAIIAHLILAVQQLNGKVR